jgi:hypothetical protein
MVVSSVRRSVRAANVVSALACASVLAWGCSGEEEKPAEAAQPIVGVMELPVSLRNADAAPSDARKVEISPAELRVDGEPVLTLTGGKIAASDRTGDIVTKLKDKLGTPARSTMSIELHAGTPYATTALVLASASTAGIRNVAFKVRKPGGSSDVGWLSLNGFHTVSAGTDATFENVATRPWSDFVNAWEAVEGACRGAMSGNCAYKPEKIAEGGQLLIALHSSGDGININFKQVGAPVPEAAPAPAKVEMLEGVPVDPVREAEEAPPATSAGFQFRAKEAQSSPSPISATIKPVCGTSACGALVQADAITLTTKVLALTGAAFPDGTPAPNLAFEVPR